MQSYSIEKEGETVDEAVQLALEEFETDIDSVEYEVLEEESYIPTRLVG